MFSCIPLILDMIRFTCVRMLDRPVRLKIIKWIVSLQNESVKKAFIQFFTFLEMYNAARDEVKKSKVDFSATKYGQFALHYSTNYETDLNCTLGCSDGRHATG